MGTTLAPSLVRPVAVLAAVGRPLSWLLVAAALGMLVVALVPALHRWRGRAFLLLGGLLVAGEGLLLWFHFALYGASVVSNPVTGQFLGRVAVPPWVESEKLYVWVVLFTLLALFLKRDRDEMLPGLAVIASVLTLGAVLLGKPFTQPLPQFLAEYSGYVQAVASGNPAVAQQGFQQMAGSMVYYYNAWYMWVHPPLLFLSYGCFAVSFVATVLMVAKRRAHYEETAYRWARLGYLPLTAGMLFGVPWALMSWTGEAWWWSGKVNMSLMMWLLYTAYLHGRIYLRRKGMWKVVAALAIVSFLALVLTYVTTYVVPGAHSVAR